MQELARDQQGRSGAVQGCTRPLGQVYPDQARICGSRSEQMVLGGQKFEANRQIE